MDRLPRAVLALWAFALLCGVVSVAYAVRHLETEAGKEKPTEFLVREESTIKLTRDGRNVDLRLRVNSQIWAIVQEDTDNGNGGTVTRAARND